MLYKKHRMLLITLCAHFVLHTIELNLYFSDKSLEFHFTILDYFTNNFSSSPKLRSNTLHASSIGDADSISTPAAFKTLIG